MMIPTCSICGDSMPSGMGPRYCEPCRDYGTADRVDQMLHEEVRRERIIASERARRIGHSLDNIGMGKEAMMFKQFAASLLLEDAT